MKIVYLLRAKSDGKQTLGALVAQFLNEVFTGKTLELKWNNNEGNASCIPVNTPENPFYLCKWTRSNRLSRESLKKWMRDNPTKQEADCPDEIANIYTYEVLNVPGRAGIRFHSANYFFQLLGCIALGDAHKDINMDGNLDAIHSGATMAEFNRLMNKEDFKLIVKNLTPDETV